MKSVMRQKGGMKGALANMTIMMIMTRQKIMLNLKRLRILGTSSKKLESSASLEVAPWEGGVSMAGSEKLGRWWSQTYPRHVNLKHMRQQRLAHMQAQPSKEDREQWQPLDVLAQRAEEGFLAETVALDRQGDVSEAVEDKHDGKPDFPGIEVVLVEVAIEEPDGEVVDEGQEPGNADGVVGADVGDCGDLAADRDVGADELAEEWSERAVMRVLVD